MTSTTYSDSKFKQGRSFFLWSLYTGKTTMIVYLSILTFLSLVCFVFGFGISLIAQPKEEPLIWQGAALVLTYAAQFIAFIFTFVFSIKEFSYFHDKRKTDMFGSLPSSRRTIFFGKLAAIVVQAAAPVIVIMTFLGIMNGGVINDFFNLREYMETSFVEMPQMNLFYHMLAVVVGILVNAVFMGFLSICCGKTVDKVLTFIIINAAYPIAMLLIQLMPNSFLVGYSVDINEWLTCAFSPYLSFTTINPLYWFIFAAVFGVLSFVLLPRRKAECAQSHFAFKAPLIITKVLVSFAAGIVLAYLFALIFSEVEMSSENKIVYLDRIMFFVGMALGSFTAYFIIQIIFAKGFKRFGFGLIPYAALLVCFTIGFIAVNTGMMGYESYVPDVDEIESVSLIGGKELIIDGKNVIDGRITDPEEIAECVEGHKEAVEYSKKQHYSIAELAFAGGSAVYDDYNDWTGGDLTFTYKLKNGMTVKRDYGYIYENNSKFMKSEVYKHYTSLLFLADSEYVSEIEIYDDYDTGDFDNYIEVNGEKIKFDENYFNDKEHRVELVEAIKSDMKTYGTDDELSETICDIYVYFGSQNEDNNEFGYDDFVDIDIMSNYKKTIEVLRKSGATVKSGKSA